MSKFHFWLAPGERKQELLQALRDADRIGLLASAHLFVPPGQEYWYRNGWAQDEMSVPLNVYRGITAQRSTIVRLASTIADQLARQPELSRARHVIVSPVRSALAVVDWLEHKYHDLQLVYVPSFDHGVLADIGGNLADHIDQLACSLLKSLFDKYPHRGIHISLWADLLIAKVPELADRSMRKVLIGSRRFSDYAQLLGLRIDGTTICPNQTARPRPDRLALIRAQDRLSDTSGKCLFLHWANQLTGRYPALEQPDLRLKLFGKKRLADIAADCGLVRKGQFLLRGDQSRLVEQSLSPERSAE